MVHSDYTAFFIVINNKLPYIVMFSRLLDYLYYLACPDKEFARQLYRIMGFYPRNIEIYREALMHRSLNHYRPQEQKKDNERLEYLGDAVIETVVSDILYHHFPKKKEGFLTSTRSKIVQRSSLNRLGKETGLVELVQSTHINRTHNSFISGNAFEAFVGAIYLDRGYTYCYSFFENRLIGKYINLDKVSREDDNHKSKLIEWSQKKQYKLEFELVGENTIGTNSPTFRSLVRIEGLELGTGFGYSKKESQQQAAKEALQHIRKKTELYKKAAEQHEARLSAAKDEESVTDKGIVMESSEEGNESTEIAQNPTQE